MKIQMKFRQGNESEMHITEMTAGELDSIRILLQAIVKHGTVLNQAEDDLSLQKIIEQLSEDK